MILHSPNYLRSMLQLKLPSQHEYKALTCHAALLRASSAAILTQFRDSLAFSFLSIFLWSAFDLPIPPLYACPDIRHVVRGKLSDDAMREAERTCKCGRSQR